MNGILLAAQVESIATRADNTLKVGLGLQELSPSKAAELLGMRGRLVAVYISPKETVPQSEISQVDAVEVDIPTKSQARRLRNVLYILWTKAPEGFNDFDTFYKNKTEAMIKHFKSKIPA